MRIALLRRQIELWLALRAIQVPLLLFVYVGGDPIRKRLAEPQPAVVLVAAAIGLFEMRRHHEFIIVGNLGITWRQLAAILILPGAIIEAAIALLGSF
jgi:lipopolysaccharide export LptBFGC system permease protein LptF